MRPVDVMGLVVPSMDDVDLAALRMRIDLISEDAEGAVHAGTQGVENGYNVRSETSGFRSIVFAHQDTVSFWCHHHRRMRANATFAMPWDDDLKAAMALGEPGMLAFADIWRTVLDAPRLRHFSSSRVDPAVSGPIGAVHDLIAAILSVENPRFPTWDDVAVTMPTWIGGGSITVNGKPILTSAAERTILALLPTIVELEQGKESYAIRGMSTSFRFQPMDAVGILRARSRLDVELPDKCLRKAGMKNA
jgi:hypothetical protein